MQLTLDNSFEIRKEAAIKQNYGTIIRFDEFSIFKDLTGVFVDTEVFEYIEAGYSPKKHLNPQIILSPHPLPSLVCRYFQTPDEPSFRKFYDRINILSLSWIREAFFSGGFGLEVHNFNDRDLRKNIFIDDIEWLDRRRYVEGSRSKRHWLGAAATFFTPLSGLAGVPYVLLPRRKVGATYDMKLKGINDELISFTSLKIPGASIYAGQVLELYATPRKIPENKSSENKSSENKSSENKSSEIEF